MEALRNYAQHRDLPVHVLASKGTWTKQDARLSIYAVPRLDLLQLSQDQAFKRSVLAELSQAKHPTTLTPFVRDYIKELVKIHGRFRSLSKQFQDDWNSTIGRALAEYMMKSHSRKIPSQIWAVAKGENRKFRKIDLFYAARSRGLEDNTKRLSKITNHNVSW